MTILSATVSQLQHVDITAVQLAMLDIEAFKGPIGGLVGLAFGGGFMSGYGFSTRTSLTAAKEYMAREKQLLEERVITERQHLEARMKEYKELTDARIQEYRQEVVNLRTRVRELEMVKHERSS